MKRVIEDYVTPEGEERQRFAVVVVPHVARERGDGFDADRIQAAADKRARRAARRVTP